MYVWVPPGTLLFVLVRGVIFCCYSPALLIRANIPVFTFCALCHFSSSSCSLDSCKTDIVNNFICLFLFENSYWLLLMLFFFVCFFFVCQKVRLALRLIPPLLEGRSDVRRMFWIEEAYIQSCLSDWFVTRDSKQSSYLEHSEHDQNPVSQYCAYAEYLSLISSTTATSLWLVWS